MGDYSVKAVLSAVDRGFTSTLKGAAGAIEGLGSKLKNGVAFGTFASMGAKAFDSVIGGAKSLVGEIDQSNAAWKTFTSNMSMLGKGADEIDSVKKELQSFAQETIYSSSDMASTFAQLEAVGTKNTLSLVKGFGGLAAAAENPAQAMKTLSMQATQMAAKPKVAWEDFKLILEQTPAGVAAVAKEMGMSTQEMVTAVQDGTVKTEDFFNALATVGTNDAFTQLATEAKTAGQAMDGLKETLGNKLTPAFDVLSGMAIKGLEGITSKIEGIDGEALAASITVDKLKASMVSFGTVAGSAIMAIGGIKAFDTLSAGAKSFGLSFDSVMGGVQTVTRKTSDIISGVGKKIGNINFDSLAKNAKRGVKSIDTAFKKVGDAVDAYGGKIAYALEAVSKNLSDKGIAVWGKFAKTGDKISGMGDTISKSLKKGGSAIGKFVDRASTIASPLEGIFKGVASGIGTGIQASASVGMETMNRMVSGMASVMHLAMSSLGPAAILGLVLAGLGLVNRQFSSQIDTMIQTAIGKGPQIIKGLISSIMSRLPALMSAGAQLLAGFMQAVTVNLPVVANGGVSIIHALVQGVIANLPMMMPVAIQLVATFADSILNALPQLLVTGMQFLDAVSRGILTNADLIVDSASEIINGFMGNIQTKLPQILTLGMGILENLAQGAVRILPQLTVVGLNAITTFIQGIANNIPQIMQKGIELVKLLVQGTLENLPMILEAGIQAVTAFLQGIGENIPVLINSGAEIIRTLIDSIKQAAPQIASAGWEIVKALGNGIKEAVTGIDLGSVMSILGGVIGYKAFSKTLGFLKSYNPFNAFKKNTKDALGKTAKSVGKSKSVISQAATGIGNILKAAGQGVASAAQGIGKGVGAAFKGIGAGLKLVKPAQLIALGTAIAIVNAGFALLATQGEGVAAIIRSFGEAIAAAAPFVEAIGNSIATVLAVAITAVSNAMLIMAPILPIIAQSLTMLSPLVTALGEAFSIAASGVGTAISMIISAVVPLAAVISEAFTQIASVVAGAVVQIVQAIAPILPEITSAFTQITSIISNAIVAIVQAIAPYTPCLQAMVEATSTAIQAVCTAFSNLVSQIAPVIDSVTSLIEQLGEGISQTLSGVSDIVSSVGETVAGVMESIGGAISSVIDSISGVFDSLGNAALNAGTGFEKLANGLEIIVDLPFFDLAGSLAAVAAGLGGITILSGDLESLGSGMQMFSDGLAIVSSQGLTASTAFTSLAGTILPLASSVPQLAPAMLQAGEAIQTFAAGALIALASLVTSAASVTAFSSNLLALVATAASAAVTITLLTAAAKSVETGMKAIAAGAKNADRSLGEIANSATDVGTVLKKLSSIGKQALKVLAQAFDDTAKRAQTAGKKTGTGYAAGIQSGLAKAPSVALMAVSAVYSALSSGYSQAYAAGAYISRGFAQGMLSCLGIIRSAAAQMAAAADEAVRAKAKIHSPSRVADKLGGYWGSGLAGGMLGKVKEVWNAAEKLISIPAIQTPDLQLAYAGDMSADYEYYRNTEYTIVVPVEIDGKEVARTTAPYTEEELNKRQRREQRKHGKA